MRHLTSGLPPRDGLVPRPRLVRPLLGSAHLRLALVAAPAGDGKTTILSQWDERDRRPFAWVTLDDDHNEPRQLLASIASVLDMIEPLDAGGASLRGDLLHAIEGRKRSFVLVLDDVHLLEAPQSLEILSAIVDHLPRGSQLALACRGDPGMPVGRLRANRNMVELRFRDLVMTPSEAAALLRFAGLDLGDREIATIVQRTEGWAAGLYLAALSLRGSADPAEASLRFGGDDRLVADYLRDEVLSGLSESRITFMARAAVLESPSGPLCDAGLDRSDSARVLADIERSNVLLFTTEDGRYRYHGLLRQMLEADLRRSEPEL